MKRAILTIALACTLGGSIAHAQCWDGGGKGTWGGGQPTTVGGTPPGYFVSAGQRSRDTGIPGYRQERSPAPQKNAAEAPKRPIERPGYIPPGDRRSGANSQSWKPARSDLESALRQ